MSSNLTIDLSGLDELQKDLNKMANDYPVETDKAVRKIANKLKREVRKASPHGERKAKVNAKIKKYNKTLEKGERKKKQKKHLRNQWKIDYVGIGANTRAELYSNAPHYHLLERGHAKIAPYNFKHLGFQPGLFFFKKTVSAFENSGQIEKAADNLLSNLKQKAGL